MITYRVIVRMTDRRQVDITSQGPMDRDALEEAACEQAKREYGDADEVEVCCVETV